MHKDMKRRQEKQISKPLTSVSNILIKLNPFCHYFFTLKQQAKQPLPWVLLCCNIATSGQISKFKRKSRSNWQNRFKIRFAGMYLHVSKKRGVEEKFITEGRRPL